MLVGIVSYAIRTSNGVGLEHFQPRLATLLKELKEAPQIEDLPWYDDVYEIWTRGIPQEMVVDLTNEFRGILEQATVEQLVPMCQSIRIKLLVENARPYQHEIDNCFATYTIKWKDGRQVEYTCRAMNIRGATFEAPLLSQLTQMYGNQFTEACVYPGLDTYHDQVAKPFDEDKFQELVTVLNTHINNMPAAEREAYEHIVTRLTHQFGPGPNINPQPADDGPPLKFTQGGGGFQG